ncbi:MAG TPA: FkbM family methyltransferase [Sphingobium sp.]
MTAFAQSSRTVFDLGMNNGDDTDYYLKLGFEVVALEANPALCDKARARFAAKIDSGRLTVVHAAISDRSGEAGFLVNLDNDHWSSLDPGWAGRDGSNCQSIQVRCVTLAELFERHGVPFFLKIDVEGVDHIVLDQLRSEPLIPPNVSVEDCRFGFDYLATLAACGYDGFKILDQSTVGGRVDPTVGHVFPAGSSGPLGRDIEQPWLPYDEMVEYYAGTVRDRDGNRLAPRTQWWDIHCTRLTDRG